MFLSKSFGYALRGILYIAMMQEDRKRVQLDEIAEKLSVPKHFLGKIMKQVAKAGLLQSTKGPYGGFSLAEKTLESPLINLVKVTDEIDQFNLCVLKLKYCNGVNPCPLHYEMEEIKAQLLQVFTNTTIGHLLHKNENDFIKSLVAH